MLIPTPKMGYSPHVGSKFDLLKLWDGYSQCLDDPAKARVASPLIRLRDLLKKISAEWIVWMTY